MSLLDDITGKSGADASKDAAAIQAESAAGARKLQSRFLKTIRRDLAPYREAGAAQLPGLNALISDPQAQLNFIQNNPFFNHLAGDATNRLMNIQAAQGRLGTGDTPAALQNQLLFLGDDLLQRSIGNRFNMASMGQNSAAQTGQFTQNAGNAISDLMTGGASALAAGRVGAANARAAGANNILNAGLNGIGMMAGNPIMLSDRRFKTDIEVLGKLDCGIPVCSFRYVFNPQKIVGVMAQDVEEVIPSAVVDVFGVKFVDYSELERVLH